MLLPSSQPGVPFTQDFYQSVADKTKFLVSKCANRTSLSPSKSRESSPSKGKFRLCPCKGPLRPNGKKTLTKWYVKVSGVLQFRHSFIVLKVNEKVFLLKYNFVVGILTFPLFVLVIILTKVIIILFTFIYASFKIIHFLYKYLKILVIRYLPTF